MVYSEIVYIVMPCLRKPDITRECLESIKKNTPEWFYRVILIDNGSEDNKKNFENFCPKGSIYIYNSKPKNVTDSWNQGIKEALRLGADYILIMNNDVVVGKKWLEELVRIMRENQLWCLSPDYIAGEKPKHFEKLVEERLEMPEDLQPRAGRFCFICPAKTFKRVGLFDRRFHYWHGDDDFELRLRQRGKIPYYTRRVIVYHYESKTLNERRLKDERFAKRLIRDAEEFAKKWGV